MFVSKEARSSVIASSLEFRSLYSMYLIVGVQSVESGAGDLTSIAASVHLLTVSLAAAQFLFEKQPSTVAPFQTTALWTCLLANK